MMVCHSTCKDTLITWNADITHKGSIFQEGRIHPVFSPKIRVVSYQPSDEDDTDFEEDSDDDVEMPPNEQLEGGVMDQKPHDTVVPLEEMCLSRKAVDPTGTHLSKMLPKVDISQVFRSSAALTDYGPGRQRTGSHNAHSNMELSPPPRTTLSNLKKLSKLTILAAGMPKLPTLDATAVLSKQRHVDLKIYKKKSLMCEMVMLDHLEQPESSSVPALPKRRFNTYHPRLHEYSALHAQSLKPTWARHYLIRRLAPIIEVPEASSSERNGLASSLHNARNRDWMENLETNSSIRTIHKMDKQYSIGQNLCRAFKRLFTSVSKRQIVSG